MTLGPHGERVPLQPVTAIYGREPGQGLTRANLRNYAEHVRTRRLREREFARRRWRGCF